MTHIKRELTKEKYDQLTSMPYKDREKALFPDGIPDAWAMGYGYYGHEFAQKDGKYYVVFRIGDSCD